MLYTLSGDDPEGLFPVVPGHEGAGVVVEVGEGRDQCETGRPCDPGCTPPSAASVISVPPVKPTLLPSAKPWWQRRDAGRHQPFSYNGQPLYHHMGCSTFSEYTVVAEVSLAKINPMNTMRSNGLPARLRRDHQDRRGTQYREGTGRGFCGGIWPGGIGWPWQGARQAKGRIFCHRYQSIQA